MQPRRASWFADSAMSTWVDLLAERASHEPESTALIYSADGENFDDRLDFRTLDLRARDLAARLQGRFAAGDRALLLYRPGLEFVAALFGCFYAGIVAVPTYPPRSNRTGYDPKTLRAAGILKDSGAELVLTERAQEATARALFPETFVLASDAEVSSAAAPDWRRPELSGAALAILQYTSGSTSTPKGVALTHRGLLANSAAIRSAFGHTAASRGLNWLPHEHDMGLIGAILQPLYALGPTVLMSPLAFLQAPSVWLRAITRHRATTSGGPTFAYSLAADRTEDDDLVGLDLSSWDVAFVGAEPVRAAALESFSRRFEPAGFRREAFLPCYGLAEATLLVTSARKGGGPRLIEVSRAALERGRAEPRRGDEPAEILISSGVPVASEVRIVEAESCRALDSGWVGEIWVRSDSVAAGYFSRPDDPAFGATIRGAPGEFLRTGDLGFLLEGELYVSGRQKDVIIVDGANYFAEDIEAAVEGCHPELRPGVGAAFAVEANGSECVGIVWETRRARTRDGEQTIAGAIRSAVSAKLSVPIADVVLVRPGLVPRTESGKIRRGECRTRYLAGALKNEEND